MPDSALPDTTVLTSSFYETYIRPQVIVTCTSATRPTGSDGRVIYETDTEKFYVYENSTWNLLGGGRWITYTPSWTNLTVGNGTQSAEYRYVPGGIRVTGSLTWGSTTSIAGTVSLTVPNGETSRAASVSVGSFIILDNGTRFFVGQTIALPSATVITFKHSESGNAGELNATNPATFTTGDVFYWDITVRL